MNKLSGAETAPLLFRISDAAQLEFGIWPRLTQSQERNGESWPALAGGTREKGSLHLFSFCACVSVRKNSDKTLLSPPPPSPHPSSSTHTPQGERSLLVHHFIVYTCNAERTTVAERRRKKQKPPERFMSLPAHLLCIAAV